MDASKARSLRVIAHLWRGLQLPEAALDAVHLEERTVPFTVSHLPSSFHVDALAQATIGLFHLVTAHYHALSTGTTLQRVTVSPLAAALEFKSETHFAINGEPLPFPQSFGGLHATRDGHVRIHDGFEVHREGTRQILGLQPDAGRAEVAAACLKRSAKDLEDAAFKGRAVIGALRSFQEWDNSAPGKAVPDFPIQVSKHEPSRSGTDTIVSSPPLNRQQTQSRALAGLRVVELSRVIAAPVAGRALAAHGADVIWVTSPNLEDQPVIDRDFARGKRSIRLDLDQAADKETLLNLIKDADVFLQGYRPDSLAHRGFGLEDLRKINPRLIYASMSAYPQTDDNPWRYNRGFDSIVQNCSGINVTEAEQYCAWVKKTQGESPSIPAMPLPCQALDHGSGFLLAAGIMTALCRRHESGLGQNVAVSLAGMAQLLRSVGQVEPNEAFEGRINTRRINEVLQQYGPDAEAYFATSDSEFGPMKYVKPAAAIEGLEVGWDLMPRALGSDEAKWG